MQIFLAYTSPEIMTNKLPDPLRGHNWVHFAHSYSVLLPWIQTSLS